MSLHRKRGRNIVRKRCRWLQGSCLLDTTGQRHMWSHNDCGSMHKVCKGVGQLGFLQRGSSDLNCEVIYSWYPDKDKVSFLQWSGTGCINHTSRQVQSPWVAWPHKINLMVLLWIFWLILICLTFFCLTGFHLFWFWFCSIYTLKEERS